MGRILALDYGESRIGVEVSDEKQLLSQMPERAIVNDALVLKKITNLVRKYEVEKLLIGLPLGMKGQSTESTEKAREFGKLLEKKFGLPVEFADERLTTKFSNSLLMEKGMGRAEKKALVDNQAAQIILEDYLKKVR